MIYIRWINCSLKITIAFQSKYFQLTVSGIHYKNAKSNKVHFFYEKLGSRMLLNCYDAYQENTHQN